MTQRMREYRFDPLQRRWSIIATGRDERPLEHRLATPPTPTDVPCEFCPGGEEHTPAAVHTVTSGTGAWRLRVVPNKYPVVTADTHPGPNSSRSFPSRAGGHGVHEVIIETPEHDSRLSERSADDLELLLRVYRDRIRVLAREPGIRHVQVFRNDGPLAGASIVHPHSQVLAISVPSATFETELTSSLDHHEAERQCLMCETIEDEIASGERILSADEDFVSFCPYASRVPFEVCLAPRVHRHDFAACNDRELRHLARHLGQTSRRLDDVLASPSFNLILHTSSVTQPDESTSRGSRIAVAYHWHVEILPRLTTLAGFEWATGVFINSVAPENAAATLRSG